MKRRSVFLVVCVLFMAVTASVSYSAPKEDVGGSQDHPLFNRMPGFVITKHEQIEFDSFGNFLDGEGKKTTVEGKHTMLLYFLRKGEKQPSEAQIVRNFEDAVTSAGGKEVFQKGSKAYFRLEDAGNVVWVYLRAFNRGGSYELHVIEQAAMRQDIVVDADAMAKEIARTGKVSLYGIYFDTGKSVLKPESDSTLEQIATLLNNNRSLSLYVVGHTDGTGDFGSNITLSEQRAAAVRDALVSRYGIDQSRLSPHGVGPLAPASTNETDDGRTLNRRTELVKK